MPYCNELFYRRYDGGAGAFSHPTILLHGLGGTHLSWPANLRRIRGLNIIALDLPGHGASKIAACVRIKCHVDALLQFVSKLGFEQIDLVGHSMGAMIAHAFAVQHPARVRKLSLLSLGTSYRFSQELERFFSTERTKQKGIDLLLEQGFHPDFPRIKRRELFSPLQSTRTSLLFADAQVCNDFTVGGIIDSPSIPIQIITGREDALVPLPAVRDLARIWNIAEMHVLENCGHSVVFERPDEVKDLLVPFLTRPVN